jgi:ribosomal protein L7/L12
MIFKITYTAKDGTTKKARISAISQDEALKEIADLDQLDFVMTEEDVVQMSIPKVTPDLWDLKLTAVHPSCKLAALKCVKNLTNLGLKESKDIVDFVNAGNSIILKEGVSGEEALDTVRLFQAEASAILVAIPR